MKTKLLLLLLLLFAAAGNAQVSWKYIDAAAAHKTLEIPYPLRDSILLSTVSKLSTPLPWWMLGPVSDSLAKFMPRADSAHYVTPYALATFAGSTALTQTGATVKAGASDTMATKAYARSVGGGGQLYWLPAFTKPNYYKYTWLNQGSATSDTTNNGSMYIEAATATTDSIHVLYKTLADSNTNDIVVAMLPQIYYVNYQGVGILWRNAYTGKMIALEYSTRGAGSILYVNEWNSATGFSADLTSSNVLLGVNGLIWLRLKTTGGNRYCYWAVDGYHWNLLYSFTASTFITSATEVGFFIHPNATAGKKSGLTIVHWKEN
jgi:hypothetical protein